ncbi:MAG: Maf family nucleotide pyrophosphatase [Betaproteobacteria bacterium]
MTQSHLILASSSRYRRELLARLQIKFIIVPPGIDEASAFGEAPAATATRLARAKAYAVAASQGQSVVIGSDQVAESAGLRLGKPGNRANAIRQLTTLSGQTVEFHSAVCVVGPGAAPAEAVIPTEVRFRRLTLSQIERYVDQEQPYDCAGSAKAEGLGIALIERIDSADPTALIGLPLIALTDLLARHGVQVL